MIMTFSSSSSQDSILGIMESLLVCLKWCKEKVEQEKGTLAILFSVLIHGHLHYRQKQQGSALSSSSPLQDTAVDIKNVLWEFRAHQCPNNWSVIEYIFQSIQSFSTCCHSSSRHSCIQYSCIQDWTSWFIHLQRFVPANRNTSQQQSQCNGVHLGIH